MNWSSSPLCTITVRISVPSRLRHSFEGISLLWTLLPGKVIKLFFSTSPKTLFLIFSSVPGYRGWSLATQSLGKFQRILETVRRTRMKIKYIFLIINCNITLSIMFLRFIYAVACVRISSFLRLDSTPILGICHICLPVYPSTDTWVGSTFWLQWITLLWTAFKVCKHLFETLHSILLRVVVKSLSHVRLLATP